MGTDNQNQTIFTSMSYVTGWANEPLSSDSFGDSSTPMAYDIATVQALYGPNMTFRAGDDTYSLPTANQLGISWQAIWDVGGTDTITTSNNTGDVTINLRTALLFGPNGGGFVFWELGITGGFTIANNAMTVNAGCFSTDTLSRFIAFIKLPSIAPLILEG
ncbi:MAG: hypothetical protein AAF352_00850 [Pseudomonadota bacterium]